MRILQFIYALKSNDAFQLFQNIFEGIREICIEAVK